MQKLVEQSEEGVRSGVEGIHRVSALALGHRSEEAWYEAWRQGRVGSLVLGQGTQVGLQAARGLESGDGAEEGVGRDGQGSVDHREEGRLPQTEVYVG